MRAKNSENIFGVVKMQGTIAGLGLMGYELAVSYFKQM
jgi:3-dehydroquinate dehydratase